MGRIRCAFLGSALCTLLAAAVVSPGQNTTFKVNVRLVRLLVTVKDRAGQLIGSLNRDDFKVYDNGVPQQIALFERRTEQPLSVALLLDTSASTGIDLKYELDSVNRFLRALLREGNPDDSAALYSFNWEVTLNSAYTRRLARLENALKGLKSEGGTSMYDAIYLASRELRDRDGRHVLVLITDGGDTTSVKKFDNALEAAQLSDSVLYAIVVIPIANNAGRNTGGENALTVLAAGTGGRIFLPAPGPQLDAAFAEILRDLRTQYLIGYYPKDIPPSSERFHKLQVSVAQPGLRVIARSGYYGEH